jgi:hypothetical protein
MQQLSRPYQIALVVLVVAAAAWFAAFGRHSSSGSSSSGSSQAPSAPAQPSSQPSSGSASASSHIYHGSAPGVEGLSKDIAKAHGAVSTSEANARHLEEKSAQATAVSPGEATGSATAPATGAANAPAAKAPAAKAPATAPSSQTAHPGGATPTHAATRHAAVPAPATRHAAVPAPATHQHPRPTSAVGAIGAPVGQKEVETAVAQGKVAVLLFWNPAGTNDRAVHGQVRTVVSSRRLPTALFESSAKGVAFFGAITRQVPVYGTPTILIVGAKGHTTSLMGLQDAFSIEQAIREVRASSA